MFKEKRDTHPYFMWDSISTTHQVLRKIMGIEDRIKPVIKKLVDSKPQKFFLTGCGTSHHTAIAGKYILENIARVSNVESIPAFELANYLPQNLDEKAVVFSFSHSGRTKAVIDAIKTSKAKGAYTIAITCTDQSPITEFTDYSIIIPGREEKAGPKTRSYSAGLMLMYLFAINLRKSIDSSNPQIFEKQYRKLNNICDVIENILKNDKGIIKLSEKYKDINNVFVIGGGPNYVTALEAAIKFKETSLIHAEGVEVEEMAHGLLAVLNENTGLIAIAPQGKSYPRIIDLFKAANIIGSPTFAILSEDDKGLSKISLETIKIPSSIDERFSMIPYIVPLQMFAYYLTIKKGRMPDWVRTEEEKYAKANLIVFPNSVR